MLAPQIKHGMNVEMIEFCVLLLKTIHILSFSMK